MRWAVVLLVLLGACTTTKVYYVTVPVDADMASQKTTDLAISPAPTDLAEAIDMAQLIPSSDMAQPPGADMTVACGSEAGIACCPGNGVAAYCADRGSLSGQRLVCHAGTCAECGGMMQLCCDFNMCAGSGVCAGPASAFYGYCG